MSNAALFARYDLPWKAALTHAFRAFVRFFFPELYAQIDWSQRPRFRDKELAGISLGATPDSMVADKLVEVALRDGRRQWVLVHVEVQAQHDAMLAERVLDYNYRIFKEHRQQVASLVLLADEDPSWRPHAFHNDVLGTVMGISFVTAKLIDYATNTDVLQTSANPFAWITLAHLRTQQARHDQDQLYAAKWQLTKLLYRHGWRKARIITLFKVINWMMALPESHQQRYWRAVLKLEKELKMECVTPLEQSFIDKGWKRGLKQGLERGLQQGREQGLKQGLEQGIEHGREQGIAQGREQGIEQGREQGIEQGREQGIEQGLAQGRKEGALALLERQLTRRFGALPASIRNKLAKASLPQLEAWSDALPEAQSLKHIFR
ncbi:DUF4351 domain-containing protein [Duganella callida]|uniref:DUF4351 domain-containing protein n=1 Tax=Duganella callida TaxID=2561932 RepID=A0A4Y9S5K2_9BURK|nr:DUF4351 domain-containing protein [Duganella callida]TFW16471.1 DUF4351 domain-containing protein [Duganella callida]